MSTIFTRPITTATFTVLSQSRNFQKPSRVCVKRLNLWGELGCKRSVFCARGIENRNIMEGLNGVRASMSEDDVQAFEQEALVEGSTLSFGAGALEATVNSLSKWLVAVFFGAIILLRHDGEAMWALMGAVLNAILSITLKKILNHERPIPTARSDPGMPSSHAQSIFFIVTFVCASMVEWFGINGFTATLSGLFFILGSYFTWLRVSQKLHTVSQVIVGALIGTMFSIFWFWSWNAFVLNLFVSSLLVRLLVVLAATGFCIGFLYHVYRTWILEER